MIRGKKAGEALAILQFTNKRAAESIEKCLRSAIANATEAAERANVAVDPDDLWVKACFVDMGPTKHRRRVRPAPQGRAYREQRHFCHVTVLLSNEERAAGSGLTKKAAGARRSVAKAAGANAAKRAATTERASNKGGAAATAETTE
jgi:large subunit ribosomal protein L22